MRVSIFFMLILAGSFQALHAQERNSIGIRLGDPTGVTYKRYLNSSHSFEFGLGTAGRSWNHGYYQRSFEDKSTYKGYNYNSHHVNGVIYFQGRYLLNYELPIQGVEGEFDWYWGLGAVMKLADVDYYYSNNEPPYSYIDSRIDLDIGPEAIGGLEYKFSDVPFTLFAEVSIMLELGDNFGVRGFLGTGGRYIF